MGEYTTLYILLPPDLVDIYASEKKMYREFLKLFLTDLMETGEKINEYHITCVIE